MNKILFIMLFMQSTWGYFPRTPIESIITSRALVSSIITNVRNEFTMERIAIQIADFQFHSNDYLFLSIIPIIIYGQFKFQQGSQIKIEQINEYQKIQHFIKEFIFVITFIFTKDVHNVY